MLFGGIQLSTIGASACQEPGGVPITLRGSSANRLAALAPLRPFGSRNLPVEDPNRLERVRSRALICDLQRNRRRFQPFFAKGVPSGVIWLHTPIDDGARARM